jgi:exonuclease III
MTWNTLFAGFDGSDDKRRRLQFEVIREINPDILLLQEARNFQTDDNRLLMETEIALGMRGVLGIAPKTGQNVAVFYRNDIELVSRQVDDIHFYNVACIVEFKIPEIDAVVTMSNVHLCHSQPNIRWDEARVLSQYADSSKLVLLAGDFNAVSLYDAEPLGWKTLPAHFKERHFLPGAALADRETMAILDRAGFVDIAYHFKKNNENTVPCMGTAKSEFVPFRCDYVLATPKLAAKVKSYTVIKDQTTDIASDHYPIVVEFKF